MPIRKQLNIIGFFVLFGFMIIHESCRKDPVFNTDPNFRLEFSKDTISFDTIFTSFGSTTFLLKVYNRSDKDVDIRRIQLTGGLNGEHFFRMNVDGDTSLLLENIRLRKKDSLLVFIKTTIDTNDYTLPFCVEDAICFSYNTCTQNVILQAFGQNAIVHQIVGYDSVSYGDAYVHIPYSIADCSVPWTAGKPHIIYGYLRVKSGEQLILEAGTHLHFAPDAGLWVEDGGSLIVNGTFENKVIFEGMRMDADYKDIPGQWNRIWLSAGSINNEIDWAVIRNGKVGLYVDSVANLNHTLIVSNTIIDNMQNHGIWARNAKIQGWNLQVSNCGNHVLALTQGGDYAFEHCTFANYFSFSSSIRRHASVLLNNDRPLTRADFTSCIIYGTLQEELSFDFKSGTAPNYNFYYCNIRTRINRPNEPFYDCKINADPLFKAPLDDNFEISSIRSPAFGNGKKSPGGDVEYDLKNKWRPDSPTIGAYEFDDL